MRTPALALLLCLAAAAPLAAHTRLERSSPAEGDTLRTAPRELRLVFSQSVDARYTTLVLLAPDGSVIDTPALQSDERRREFVTAPPEFITPGRYRIEWRTTAADGHVITGVIGFVFDPGDVAAATAPQAAVITQGTASEATAVDDPALGGHRMPVELLPLWLRPDSATNVLVRALLFATLLAIIGLAAFHAVVLPGSGVPPQAADALRAGLRRFGTAAAGLLLLALAARLWLQVAALHGPALALRPSLILDVLLDLRWGQAWLIQLAAAAAAGIAILAGSTPLLVLAALALAGSPAFQGHASAVESAALARLLDGAHVLAAGAWIGTLLVLVLAAVPALRRGAGDAPRYLNLLVRRFSPLALAAAALLAASGIASSLLHVPSVAALWESGYGRMLLMKLFFVATVIAAGAYNWRRARPRLEEPAGAAALYRSATLELALAGAVVAATAVLVALPTP